MKLYLKCLLFSVIPLSSLAENSSYLLEESKPPGFVEENHVLSDETSSKTKIKETSTLTSKEIMIQGDSKKDTEKIKATRDSISESFAPEKEDSLNLSNNLIHDISWFFEKRKTKHKIALVPVYSYDKTENSLLGIRFFSFSPEKEGYYIATSLAKYWPKDYYSFTSSYISNRKSVFRSKINVIYDNHYENYYGDIEKIKGLEGFEGMTAPLNQKTKVEAHRLIIDYNIFHQEKSSPIYFGGGAKAFFRKERKQLQKNKSYFQSEYFLFLKAFLGMDTRDNWKYPKKGVYHQASFGCKPTLVFSNFYCQVHGDLRSYNSLFKETKTPHFIQNSIVSFRAFFGRSLFNPASYSTKYSLGGEDFFQQLNGLRAFKSRRFLGDKIYLAQSELHLPLWKEYLIAVTFFELGETTQINKPFTGFVTNYGLGLRIGWFQDSGMKIRLDYSVGKDRQDKKNSDFIISFLQAF